MRIRLTRVEKVCEDFGQKYSAQKTTPLEDH